MTSKIKGKIYRTARLFKNHFKSLCLYAFTGSLFTSCVKDDFEFDKIKGVEWSPELAAPLVNTSLTFKDILNKNSGFQVGVDQENFCTYYYSDTLYTLRSNDMLTIKDQTVKYDFSMDNNQAALFTGQGTLEYNQEQHISFKPDEEAEIDSIHIKSGMFNMEVISSFKQNTSIRITLPGLKKNGVAFSKEVILNYQNVLPLKENIAIDLADYLLDITNNGSAVNDLTVLYKIKITSTGNPVKTTDALSMDAKFEGIQFKSAFGYLGQQDYSGAPDTLNFNFFNSQPGLGTFTLADPKLKVTMINSIGIPIHASIPQFTAYNSVSGTYSLNTGMPNPLPVYSPQVNQVGQSLSGSFELNSVNSNLVTLISKVPEYFIYQVGMKTNPNGKQGQNFITDSSSLSLYADISLPLYGSAKDFVITDTADFKIDHIDEVESMMMRASFSNGFPISVAVQVYFTDSNYVVIDSLIHDDAEILKAAPVDVFTGKTTASTDKSTDIVFDLPHIEKIKAAKKIITVGKAETTNHGNTNVKIFSDYSLSFKVGAKVKLKFNP